MPQATTAPARRYTPCRLTRRRFLCSAAGGAALTALAASGIRTLSPQASAAQLEARTAKVGEEDFVRCLRQSFRFSSAAAAVDLELEAVEQRPAVGGGESFAAVFRGPAAQPLRQDTYEVWNRSLGDFALFVVPWQAQGNVQRYEAVFNRLAG